MATTLKANFETRREAEMVIERMVQEHRLDRSDIFVAAEGPANTAGVKVSGSDTGAGEPTPPDREDAALNGVITVSVDINDDAHAAEVRAAFQEFNAEDVTAD